MLDKKLISSCVLDTLPEDYRIFNPETICPYDISFSNVDFSQAEDKIFNQGGATELTISTQTVWNRLTVNYSGNITIHIPSGNLIIQRTNNNGGYLTINSNDVIAIQQIGGNSGSFTISGDIVAETFRNGFANHTTINDGFFLKEIYVFGTLRTMGLVAVDTINVSNGGTFDCWGSLYIDNYNNIILENNTASSNIQGGVTTNYLPLTKTTPMPLGSISAGLVDLKEDGIILPEIIHTIKYLKTNSFSYTNVSTIIENVI